MTKKVRNKLKNQRQRPRRVNDQYTTVSHRVRSAIGIYTQRLLKKLSLLPMKMKPHPLKRHLTRPRRELSQQTKLHQQRNLHQLTRKTNKNQKREKRHRTQQVYTFTFLCVLSLVTIGSVQLFHLADFVRANMIQCFYSFFF